MVWRGSGVMPSCPGEREVAVAEASFHTFLPEVRES